MNNFYVYVNRYSLDYKSDNAGKPFYVGIASPDIPEQLGFVYSIAYKHRPYPLAYTTQVLVPDRTKEQAEYFYQFYVKLYGIHANQTGSLFNKSVPIWNALKKNYKRNHATVKFQKVKKVVHYDASAEMLGMYKSVNEAYHQLSQYAYNHISGCCKRREAKQEFFMDDSTYFEYKNVEEERKSNYIRKDVCNPKITCPRCGAEGPQSHINRWHGKEGERCKRVLGTSDK